jgi:hypothetical protein
LIPTVIILNNGNSSTLTVSIFLSPKKFSRKYFSLFLGPKLQSSLESYVEELTAQPPNVLFVSSSFLESYPTIIQDLMKKFPKTKIYLNQPRSEPCVPFSSLKIYFFLEYTTRLVP